ncbi:MAG: helix-turn-helix domain-containing protein [Gemmatimonadaceae bacterium]
MTGDAVAGTIPLDDQDYGDDLDFRANDETRADTLERQAREAQDAKLRNALDDPKRRRAVYRDIADAHTPLTHAQFRVLSYLLRKANPDLSNAYPAQKTAARALGMKRPTYNAHLVALRRDGWVRTHEFHRDGAQSSSGVQFCIPNDVLPMGEGWSGPVRFEREYGTKKRPRKRHRVPAEATEAVVHTLNNG